MRTRAAGIGVAAMLAAVLFASASNAFHFQPGVDFYQFWGVPIAKKASAMLHSPYTDQLGYSRVLKAISDASSSQRLRYANYYRPNLEPTGTPLFYASFAAFPEDYENAHLLFAVLQYLAAGASVFVLARMGGISKWPAIWIALLVEITFDPFLQDVKVGNVNSPQLAFMTALLYAAARRRDSGKVPVDALIIGLLAVFVIFKPNTAWVAVAFAIHYGVVLERRKLIAGVSLAVVLAALAFGIGAWYFEDAHVWLEWLQYARGIDGSGLALTLDKNNVSLTMLLAERYKSFGPLGYGLIIAIALSAALVAAMSSGGRGIHRLGATMRKAFADPWFAASVGVLFTFATSPLVWPHYLMFALIPIFWLLRIGGKSDVGTWGAVICYGALSTPLIALLIGTGHYAAVPITVLLSWVALLPGLFANAAEHHRTLQTAT